MPREHGAREGQEGHPSRREGETPGERVECLEDDAREGDHEEQAPGELPERRNDGRRSDGENERSKEDRAAEEQQGPISSRDGFQVGSSRTLLLVD